MKKSKILTLVLGLSLFLSCNNDDDSNTPVTEEPSFAETIVINEQRLYPGKIDYDNVNNKFVVGSLTLGEVGHVDTQNGNYEVFIEDENFALVAGVFTDEENNRLIVASGDFGFSDNSSGTGTVAYVGVYDLETGARIASINLKELQPEGALVMANDIAVDENSNIYVTDSFAGSIYKINTNYEASIFLKDDRFNPIGNNPGINGIIYKNGYLLVDKTDEPVLFKVPLNAPSSFYEVSVSPQMIVGADGLEFNADGDLILVAIFGDNTGANLLVSNNDWESATHTFNLGVIQDGRSPTSSALASDGEIYMLNSCLGKFYSGQTDLSSFEINRTNF